MQAPRDTTEDDSNSSASFAHSLSVAPLNTTNTINNIHLALNGSTDIAESTDVHMMDATQQLQQPESRMAVAELLVSLGQSSQANEYALIIDGILRRNEAHSSMLNSLLLLNLTYNSVPMQDDSTAAFVSAATGAAPVSKSSQSPMYRTAIDYVGSVKKAYETSNPRVYADFLASLEKYHGGRYEDDVCTVLRSRLFFHPSLLRWQEILIHHMTSLSHPSQLDDRAACSHSDGTFPGPARVIDGIQGVLARGTGHLEQTGSGMS